MQPASPLRRFAVLFAIAGTALALMGAIPWIFLALGTDGAAAPLLLALGALAVVGGAFVALVGVGATRRESALEQVAAQRRLDARVSATAALAEPACAQACQTCATTCVLSERS